MNKANEAKDLFNNLFADVKKSKTIVEDQEDDYYDEEIDNDDIKANDKSPKYKTTNKNENLP